MKTICSFCWLISSYGWMILRNKMMQILKTGFFHADPHPGNLAIDMDQALIYYDFGMMGEIKSFTRERLLELFYAVYEKDAKKVCPDHLSILFAICFFVHSLCK